MTIPTIAIYTHTGLIPARFIEAWVPAAQLAIGRDFAKYWSHAKLVYVPLGDTIEPDWWQLGIFDHSDQADALGYHDLTPAGQPIAKVFAKDCIDNHENWNATGTHELEEMIGDPKIDQVVRVTLDGVTWEYARETCDAPEDDRFGQRVGGHLASNFVTPAWFDPDGKPPYTGYPCSQITAPFMLADGGYIGRREIAPNAGEWQQVMARTAGSRQIKKPSSRTVRRFNAA